MEGEKMTMISLRGHHLGILHFFLNHHDAEERLKVSLAEYGEEEINRTIGILKTIITSPADTNIKLIDNWDIICEYCKKKHSRMCRPYGRTDRIMIYHYGLELGKIYPATEILKILQSDLVKGDHTIIDITEIFEKIKTRRFKEIKEKCI